jgi:hypothetical protein
LGRSSALVLAAVVLAGCGEHARELPGEGGDPTSCGDVIPGCEAGRLENVVLRGGETDGVLFSVDGLNVGSILSFDEALEAGWNNGYRGGGKTVQVILGAADADRLRWGHGTSLYFAVEWEGACPMMAANGPPGYERPAGEFECDATIGTILDARTGEHVVTGESNPP